MNKLNLKPDPYSSFQGQSDSVVENLLERHFVASKPNEKWTSDITEFNCYWGKLYLSALLDIYSKDIVSYSISLHPNFELVEDMLNKAFTQHPNLDGLILHTDMGWHYSYYKYLNILRDHNIIRSMSRKGNCLDNAIMESFFGILKKEMYYGREFLYKSFDDLKSAIENYIFYYNNKRIKHGLGGVTPFQYRANFYKKPKT